MRSGKLGGYSYTIETKEEACRRASEKALQQAKTQNQSEDCQLGEEKDRLTKSAGWKIGELCVSESIFCGEIRGSSSQTRLDYIR